MSVLAFHVQGRPGCLRVRPRIGSKLKDYTFSADSLAECKQWAAALEAAGAELVDAAAMQHPEPPGVHGAVLHKLGGGALKEWQPRFVSLEADG